MKRRQSYSQTDEPIINDEIDSNVFVDSTKCSKKDSSTNSDIIENTAVGDLPTTSRKDSSKYEMKLNRRGICLILNQVHFEDHNDRSASEVDENTIQVTFTQLGFEVRIKRDLTFASISEVMGKLTREDHSDCDCISIFVLSHGEDNGKIYAKDMPYPLITIFTSLTNCISLAGKPKLFFIQACRGTSKDNGIKGRDIGIDANDNIYYTIPAFADFLFCYSSMDGYYSFNDPDKGSWYIQTLCRTIDELWKDTDLLRILVIAGRNVALNYTSKHNKESKNNSKQVPCVCSTLLRDLYFTPK
ncbi:unnamed protein product [Xylocopa violacea]|uniref:Caspase-3 n=1 Tax=Xylocopa violacea TaxID=135666 RepID=A0ABP1PG17_XYLVO